MTRDLEVVLLLTDERVVRVGEVETLVSVNSEVWDRSEKGWIKRLIVACKQPQERLTFPKKMYRNPQAFNSQFLVIVIQQRVPLVLLEQTESDALNL